jgi:hypothetical protein
MVQATTAAVTAAVIMVLMAVGPPPRPAAAADGLTRSVPLSEVLSRARSSPRVELVVRLQLKQAKVRRDDVLCSAQVADRSWSKLAGTAHGPYTCAIGARMLRLEPKTKYADANGERLRSSDPAIKDRATSVSEHRFQVRWSRS